MYICIYIWFRVSCSRPPPYGMGVTSPPSHPPRPHPPTHPRPPHPQGGGIHRHMHRHVHRHMHRHVHILHTVYICTYTCYIRIHKHIYIYIHTYVYIHIYIYVCMYACMYVCIHPYMMNNFRNHFSCMFCWSMATQFPIPTGACALFCRSAFAALCQSQLRGTELMVWFGKYRIGWGWEHIPKCKLAYVGSDTWLSCL